MIWAQASLDLLSADITSLAKIVQDYIQCGSLPKGLPLSAVIR